jgi:hypothetical protein
MVLQDTGPDGRTHFYVLDGATLYEQVVGLGDVVRYTEDPTSPAQLLSSDAIVGSTVIAPAWAMTSPSVDLNTKVASYLGSVTVGGAASGTLVAGSQGMSNLSGKSLTLGSPGLQSLSTGDAASDTVTFDYWLEDLVL